MLDQTLSIPLLARMAVVDWCAVAIYLTAIITYGVLVSRQRQGVNDYFLASRGSTWPTIGLALLASNISSTTLIGLSGAAYAFGIAVYDYEWMAGVVLAFFCVFFLPYLLRSQVFTMPEWLERRYDRQTRLYFTALTIFLNIVVDASGTLFGGALMLRLILPGVPLGWIIAGLAVLAGIYTVLGGLRAVMRTEVVQAVLLLCASVVISAFAFSRAGGWAHVMASVPAAKLHLILPANNPGLPWTGLVTGVPLIGFYFWCTNQFMVQRVLSARDENHGRWGVLFAGALKLPVLFLMVLPGSCALLLFPHLDRADEVYPTLVFSLLPHGLIGIVVAGFLAALMSAVASTFNSASTLVTMDLVRTAFPALSGRSLVRVGQLATLTIMVLTVAWAPNIAAFTSLWQYLQSILAYLVPPVVAIFVVGQFWRRANARGAHLALAAGLLLGMLLFYANVFATPSLGLHFLLVAPLVFVTSVAVLVLGSLGFGGAAKPGTGDLVWTRAHFAEERLAMQGTVPWKDYRVQAVVLLCMTAVIVTWFR